MKKALWAFAFLYTVILGTASAKAQKILFLTEENPPFNYTSAEGISGLATDILFRMTEIAQVPLTRDDIQILPWARAYQKLQDEPNAILFCMARTPEREKHFQWIGPIVHIKSSLIAPKNKKIVIRDLVADTRHYSIGTVRKSASDHALTAHGVPNQNIQRLHDIQLNVQKLLSGRIDLIAIPELAFSHHIKKLGADPDLFESVYPLMDNAFSFGVNPSMDPATVNKLQKALDHLTISGELDRIIARYR
ncbi:transporter substrate-binding domain-containing protein [Pseudodesulfovibrio sp. JC047]|uniref:substrate-binding periplasmic protein n=1 Tax=Pseudodesulfovibrio sp. JC047 TaxID=2683199 RepID=UPI0013D36133|nr:transporter substrate-binding domain-containing protein [Pseudodesulfovibrio sp. JC047]NDV19654.1 transporter substrate-binding domain-containing protein [Pseudodesulfovibrio sp. JC047]